MRQVDPDSDWEVLTASHSPPPLSPSSHSPSPAPATPEELPESDVEVVSVKSGWSALSSELSPVEAERASLSSVVEEFEPLQAPSVEDPYECETELAEMMLSVMTMIRDDA